MAEIEWTYRQATGRWTGCDWMTDFGPAHLNLQGLAAFHAMLLARATAGSEQTSWKAAVGWLQEIEQQARLAEEAAQQAVAQANAGDLRTALAWAQRACAIEAKYHEPLIWRPLRDAIATALPPSRDPGSLLTNGAE
jgi:hypothetical protein